MAVTRSRLLDPLERNRLDATVDVRVSARCGTSADTSLSPPPATFQTLSILFHKVRPATETFRFPCATFVLDKALHSGFFVLGITDMMSSLAFRLFRLTITPTRATFRHISCYCRFVDGSLYRFLRCAEGAGITDRRGTAITVL
ncbi:hypothetical protein F4141_09355 [Candidatus Poribacteria bacterium]|nr:hypothetical protein [Candidatus Poribacteria bacterium]